MKLKINRLIINKKVFIIFAFFFHLISSGQTITGDNINVYGSSGGSSIGVSSGGDYSGIVINSTLANISTNNYSGGSYTSNSFLQTEPASVQIGSSGKIDLYAGALNTSNGTITATGGLALSSTFSGVYSLGVGAGSYIGWAGTASELNTTTATGFLANSSGAYIQSASDLTLTGTTVSLTGATNINTTGSYNTSVGNTTGIVAVVGSAVNVGTNSGSSVTLGSSTGNSTVSLNGNRLQNVGTGVSGTDAVNLNQVNSLMSSTTSQITSLQNQANTNKSGISGVSAMANIPSLSASQKNNFGVGIGAFQGSSAIAFGGNFRIKDNLVGKISASLSSGNYVTGAGLSFGW